MSLKKIIMLATLVVLSGSALAGRASNYSAPATSLTVNDHSGVYVGFNAGWDQLGWKNQLGVASAGASWNSTGNNGSFAVGADIGYSFNQYLALEVGGFWPISNTKYYDNVTPATDTFKSWDIYAAAKATMPLYESFNVFGKFGLAYTQTKVSNDAAFAFPTSVATGTNSSFRPLFAAGLGYDFAQDWNVNAQYALILARQSNGETYSPNQSIYTLGVAYTFAL